MDVFIVPPGAVKRAKEAARRSVPENKGDTDMKLAFAAGALTLMTIAGISSTPADAQRWRGGYAHAGYGHHYRAPHLGARGHDYGPRRHGSGYARGHSGYGYARRGYGGGYGYGTRHHAGGYGPGHQQWLVNMQSRWAYDYGRWRQLYGPSGIFAGFGGGGGYGFGNRFGAGYGGGYGNGCRC
jgi:hypothetical protein